MGGTITDLLTFVNIIGISILFFIILALCWRIYFTRKVDKIRDKEGKRIEGRRYPILGLSFFKSVNLSEPLPAPHSPYRLGWHFNRPMIFVEELSTIKNIFQKNYLNYTRTTFTSSLNNSLVSSDGETAKRHRRILQKAFHRGCMKRIVILSREYFKKEIKENNKEINNVYDWAVKSISETISIISYGDSPFTSDILSAELFFQGRTMWTIIPIWFPRITKIIPLKAFRDFEKAKSKLMIIDHLINEYKKEFDHQIINENEKNNQEEFDIKGNDTENGTLLQLVVLESMKDPDHLSDQEIKENMISMGVGGNESTSSALTSTLFFLAKFPQEQNKIFEEIIHVIGEGNFDFDFDHISKLVKLSNFMKEAMRLLPPFPYMFPRSPIDLDQTSAPFSISPSMMMACPIYRVHRNKNYFENADEFQANRFENEEAQKGYLPFGVGPRHCIAQRVAMILLKVSLVVLLMKFSVHFKEGEKNDEKNGKNCVFVSNFGITQPKFPLSLSLLPRC